MCRERNRGVIGHRKVDHHVSSNPIDVKNSNNILCQKDKCCKIFPTESFKILDKIVAKTVPNIQKRPN